MGKRIWVILAAVLLFLLSAGLLVYPLFSNWYAERHEAELRTEYFEQLDETDDETFTKARRAADAYNEKLRPGANVQEDAYDEQALQSAAQGYTDLLNLTGNGLMGYVEIPEINVNLPIYHGTADDALQRGVGHLLGSSLPVGGESTHAVLSAHSGSTSKLFTDLDRLEIGDIFRLKVLNETLTYRVDDIRTVLPHETDTLGVIAGQDYCTLSTCTPFGINSHRLLVRGVRIEEQEQDKDQSEDGQAVSTAEESERSAGSTWNTMYLRAIFIGFGAALLLFLLVLPILLIKRRRGKQKKK